mmetsp:Transcript_33438/g.65216  ORF Transcript_33438/g.65216 Transcript_33438/m.65216 type:complete len:81 (-) Transcript_33438:251-493(-)|eukprot:CAMPEP_0173391888 /NCGR_PEP_ID=MMETSP1356-20130122/18641_1 /TAXON_ID=77927 ORGANISM="Hemiselmis virescens, Strain PCC157" /NCGR_SAMPLE_ID=MMETSP1356 /ASSEMBLY_ACC=CAM_ASM_000847 /LENGTH=80 /DNA_ID=CAMNT_0014349583 /DNA_START=73 /DNA_END=315 /DNA_ORIENTATION=-
MFSLLRQTQQVTMLAHIRWDMGDRGGSDTDGVYGPHDWHCYSFNREDDWTNLHDWGCFNWNMVSHTRRREDPKEKDQTFF